MSSEARFPAARVAAVLICLFLVAIPWWWHGLPATGNATFLGAPRWFITSVLGSLLISVVTVRCLALAWKSLDDEEPSS